jgi:HEPN domain-containing protein
MQKHEHMTVLLRKANQDLAVLRVSLNDASIADEIFGFHAQQAVEKLLKAWIEVKGLAYPSIHDLNALLSILEEANEPAAQFRDLADLNPFAVQFRYDDLFDMETSLDRNAIFESVKELQAFVTSRAN